MGRTSSSSVSRRSRTAAGGVRAVKGLTRVISSLNDCGERQGAEKSGQRE